MNAPMPLLTIAVPTFNRARYLEELLPQLVTQIEREPQYLVELLVIDNASTDGTRDLIASKFTGSLRYLRNPENIGGDRNFLECIKAAQGKYVWLFGDDEVINPGGVRRVIEALAQDPDLVIAESSSAATKSYDSYKALLQHVRDQDPVFPVHHTLITKNIFPKSKFDLALAQDTVQTNYGHMYGLVESLKSARKIIVLSAQDSAFHVRDVRAEFADPPTKLEDKLIRLNCHIAEALEYRRLRTDIWLYYKARPLYKLRHSKKVRKLLRLFA